LNARTLLFAKTRTPEQERVRRILFVLLLTYCVSGWMVDFAYRASFFMFTAAIAAFHRMLYLRAEETAAEDAAANEHAPAWRPPVLEPALAGVAVAALPAEPAVALKRGESMSMPWLRREENEVADEPAEPRRVWNRIGLVDLLVTAALLYGVEQFWIFAIRTF
jgi:hypothetical protein